MEFLNLQQQVQKNKEDIERHYEIDRSLANFGIRIVGVVSSVSKLPGLSTFPQAPNYVGEYGDAYAVGLEGNYIYYIYTRPDLNLGYASGYWLNVGKIFVQGPKGDPGIGLPGPQGASTRWYYGVSVPSIAAIEGDCYLITEGNAKGDLYGYKDGRWVYLMNIIGPQGNIGLRGSRGVPGESIIGPQGNRGLPGSVPIQIWGQVNSPTDLTNITPTQDNLSHAYLVGTEPPYHLWAIKQDTMVWIDLGEFAAVAGQDGGTGPRGIPGLDGNSIIYYDGVIQSYPLINTEYIYNPTLARTTTIIDDDLFIDKNANLFRVFSEEGRSCVFTGLNLKGPEGSRGLDGKQSPSLFTLKSHMISGPGYNYYMIPNYQLIDATIKQVDIIALEYTYYDSFNGYSVQERQDIMPLTIYYDGVLSQGFTISWNDGEERTLNFALNNNWRQTKWLNEEYGAPTAPDLICQIIYN